MATAARSRKAESRDLEVEAWLCIAQRRPTCADLARFLGVSVPTALRTVAALRSRGVDVVSARRSGTPRYEIRDERTWEELARDPLLGYVIPKSKVRPARLRAEDRDVYR